MACQIVNEKIKRLTPYEPITGNYPIRLDANESFRQMPAELLEQMKEAAFSLPLNRYPDPYCKELCTNFAGFYGINADNVAVWNGSDELISVLNQAFLMKGETVMTVSPDFSMYQFYCEISETSCMQYQKRADFTVDVDDLIARVNEYPVRMLIFSNPCNPTTIGLNREKIRRLVRSVNCLVALDEAYMDFWDQTMLGEVEDYENLIILRTASKAAGAAGIRLGFSVANATLIKTLKAVKTPYNVNSVTQQIGSVLYRNGDWIRSSVREIVESKNNLYALLKMLEQSRPGELKVYDGVTNFVLVKPREPERVFKELLRSGIVVRCLGDYLRITAGTAEENQEFFQCFQAAL